MGNQEKIRLEAAGSDLFRTITDIIRPHNEKLIAEGRANKAERENAKLRSALQQCEDYFDGRADVVDGSYGVPEPNREMSLLSEIREALGVRS